MNAPGIYPQPWPMRDAGIQVFQSPPSGSVYGRRRNNTGLLIGFMVLFGLLAVGLVVWLSSLSRADPKPITNFDRELIHKVLDTSLQSRIHETLPKTQPERPNEIVFEDYAGMSIRMTGNVTPEERMMFIRAVTEQREMDAQYDERAAKAVKSHATDNSRQINKLVRLNVDLEKAQMASHERIHQRELENQDRMNKRDNRTAKKMMKTQKKLFRRNEKASKDDVKAVSVEPPKDEKPNMTETTEHSHFYLPPFPMAGSCFHAVKVTKNPFK